MDVALGSMVVVGASLAVAAAAWPLVRSPLPARTPILAALSLGTALAPLLVPRGEPLVWRAVAVLQCLVVALALWDAIPSGRVWQRRRLTIWLGAVVVPLVLVHRLYGIDAPTPRARALRQLLRGGLEIALGIVVLCWAFEHPWRWFWAEHVVKLAGLYLAVFDGGFAMLNALGRLAGLRLPDFSRDPVLASTPADFWRRYNRNAGRLLWANVFLPLGGLRRPIAGILAVFVVNGLIHEWLAFAVSGKVTGLQMLFFLIQGVATAATWRVRPTGAWRVPSITLTLAFNIATSTLFFLSAESFLDWYSTY